MKTKFNGILTLLLAFVVQITFAQEKTISGVVSDDMGPLPEVNILIKGTTKGTQTDFDGNYTIKAKVGDTLVYSFVGMDSTEKVIGNENTVNVIMTTGNVLEEVIVTGYNTSTKKAYTGTIKTVKAEVLESKSVANISQALGGEVAGVTVMNTSGQPGKSAKIRIRGFGSVNGNRDPLYVVDGIPFLGDDINSINPSDIESTSVLKDATATAIYGSRGANGVVLITTKSGKRSGSSIVIDLKTGVNFSYLPRYNTIKSPERFTELTWESLYNVGDVNDKVTDPASYANEKLFDGEMKKYNMWNQAPEDLIDPSTGKFKTGTTRKYDPENWRDYAFQTSIRTEANLKFLGGNDKTKYFSSFGYLDDQGYVINSSYERYSSRLNLEHKPKDWLTATANMGYTYGHSMSNGQSADSGNVFWLVDGMPSIFPIFVRDENGAIVKDPIYGGNEYDYGVGRPFSGLTNAIADAHYNTKRNKKHSLNSNYSLKFDLTDDFKFELRYGMNLDNILYSSVNNPFYGSGASNGGSLYQEKSTTLSQNLLQMFRYNKTFGENHNINALVAHESNSFEYELSFANVNKVVNLVNGLESLTNYVNSGGVPGGYTAEENTESYFGQINYNYSGKYYVTGAVRRDGTSRFQNNKWGTFGSVGLGWVVSEESFLNDSKNLNYLKFKVSYGLVGDQSGAGGNDWYKEYYRGRNGYEPKVDANKNIALTLLPIEDPNLTWETSNMFQAGIEFTAFNKILDGSIDYYRKNTTDLVFQRRMPPSSGNALITVNDGELLNQGIEFDLTTHIINKEDFKLDFGINGEFLSNEMKKMPIDPSTGQSKILDQQGKFGRAEGYSIFDYYMRDWAGVDPEDGLAMWYMNYYDANNDGKRNNNEEAINNLTLYQNEYPDRKISETTTKKYAEATEKFIGKSAIPTVRGAFRINAEYNNFDFSTQFAYSLGGYAYDGVYAGLMGNNQVGGNNWHTDIEQRWQKKGDKTNVPRLFSNQYTQVNDTSTRFLTSTNYLALNNIKLGYSLPNEFISNTGISNVKLWISGDNLMVLSKRDGFNPTTSETGGSSGRGKENGSYRYTPMSTFTFGVKVKF